MSLDGYTADERGNFDWAAPDEEVHLFVNDLVRSMGTYLYGRRMYETMVYWETAPDDDSEPPVVKDFARIWKAADKIVYSSTLDHTSSARTRIEPRFEPEDVRRLKAEAGRDLGIGGAQLAGQAIKAELVDEYQLLLVPYLAGGGKRALPDGATRALRLVDEHRFASGAIFMRYRDR